MEAVLKLEKLIERIILRNEVLISNNKDLKHKLRALEEKVAELEKDGDKSHGFKANHNIESKLDQFVEELDKCIDITQNMIEK